jgi:putative DNA primase/helicase
MKATRSPVRAQPRARLTDAGNSLRFTVDHAGHLIYVGGPGWHVWDKKRWLLDNESAPYRAAKETAFRIRREAERIEDETVAKKVFAWALASENISRLHAMVSLARRGERKSEGLRVAVERLDARPNLLTCANGTINFKTGQLQPHDRDDYITRLVNVRYDPNATCLRWNRFLREVFRDDEEVIAYVQRAAGYSLTGETNEQAIFIAHGEGANGKSVFMETVAEAAGEWAVNAATETFASTRHGSAIPNDLARLRGARLVRAPETEDGAMLARQIIKRITGGDAVSARLLYQEWFEYYPTFKVWLVTNHLPSIPVGDYATWRRIRLIPFTRTFSPKEQDKHLRAKLRRELPGILAWAVVGAQAWYRSGLGETPEAAELALYDYRKSQDTVGRFLDEELVDDPAGVLYKTELYHAYQTWCGTEALRPISRTAFYKAVRERGYTEGKTGPGDRVFRGLRQR